MNPWPVLYRLREAREGLARNRWASLATVILLALTLVMFGGFLWINANIAQIAALLERQVEVRVFPAEGTSAESLLPELSRLPNVREAEVVRGQTVYDRLAPVFGRDVLVSALPADAFADSLSIELMSYADANATVQAIQRVEGVGEVIWGQGFAQVLYQISNGIQRGGAILIVGFFLAALLMSLTTMHLAVLNREVEIQIQRWVGVGPWGIRAQFLIESFLLGLFASVVAGAVFLYVGDMIQRAIMTLMPFVSDQLRSPVMVIGMVLVTGPLLALLGGGLASQRAIGLGDR